MGKRPAEIEREIAEQRERISSRVQEMRERGSRDAEEFTSRLSDSLSNSALKQTVEDRPMLTVAGALALGVALGMASESVSVGSLTGRRQSVDPRFGNRQQPSAGGGLMGALSAVAADEIKTLVDKWTSERRPAESGPADRRPTEQTIPGQAVVDEQDAQSGA
jgi:hypothetical protein